MKGINKWSFLNILTRNFNESIWSLHFHFYYEIIYMVQYFSNKNADGFISQKISIIFAINGTEALSFQFH